MQTGLIIQAILSLLDWLEPRLAEARKTGEVTADEQLALKTRIDQFRAGVGFEGPEWEQSGSAPSDK